MKQFLILTFFVLNCLGVKAQLSVVQPGTEYNQYFDYRQNTDCPTCPPVKADRLRFWLFPAVNGGTVITLRFNAVGNYSALDPVMELVCTVNGNDTTIAATMQLGSVVFRLPSVIGRNTLTLRYAESRYSPNQIQNSATNFGVKLTSVQDSLTTLTSPSYGGLAFSSISCVDAVSLPRLTKPIQLVAQNGLCAGESEILKINIDTASVGAVTIKLEISGDISRYDSLKLTSGTTTIAQKVIASSTSFYVFQTFGMRGDFRCLIKFSAGAASSCVTYLSGVNYGSVGNRIESLDARFGHPWSFRGNAPVLAICTETETATETETNLKLFPNPASSYLKVEDLTRNSEYKIFNLLGREVTSGNLTEITSEIDVRFLETGIYFLQVTRPDAASTTLKFIKE
jgi:Secretion system C-terminal sorting domain